MTLRLLPLALLLTGCPTLFPAGALDADGASDTKDEDGADTDAKAPAAPQSNTDTFVYDTGEEDGAKGPDAGTPSKPSPPADTGDTYDTFFGGGLGSCLPDEVLDCNGVICVPARWIGDGDCDGLFLDCAQNNFDGGDCGGGGSGGGSSSGGPGGTCPPGEVRTCSGYICVPERWIGDGECDDLLLNCPQHGNDGGDCP